MGKSFVKLVPSINPGCSALFWGCAKSSQTNVRSLQGVQVARGW